MADTHYLYLPITQVRQKTVAKRQRVAEPKKGKPAPKKQQTRQFTELNAATSNGSQARRDLEARCQMEGPTAFIHMLAALARAEMEAEERVDAAAGMALMEPAYPTRATTRTSRPTSRSSSPDGWESDWSWDDDMPSSTELSAMDAHERQENSIKEYQHLTSESKEKLSLLALRSGDMLAIRQADEASVGANHASRRPWSTLQDSGGLDDWVSCDRCNKWRRVPKSVVESLTSTSKWFCSQNADWFRASCDEPEEEYDGSGQEETDENAGGGTAGTHPNSNERKWVQLLEKAFKICCSVSLTRST
jgi:hypothetical protein